MEKYKKIFKESLPQDKEAISKAVSNLLDNPKINNVIVTGVIADAIADGLAESKWINKDKETDNEEYALKRKRFKNNLLNYIQRQIK